MVVDAAVAVAVVYFFGCVVAHAPKANLVVDGWLAGLMRANANRRVELDARTRAAHVNNKTKTQK